MQRELDAYVLTRGWRDTPQGVLLTMWLLSDEGPIQVQLSGQRDVMFVERQAPSRPAGRCLQRRALQLQTLHGVAVDGLYFGSRRQLLEERDWLSEQGCNTYETDIKPSERFLMERFITGGCRVRGHFMKRTGRVSGAGYLAVRNPRMTASDYRPKVRTASVDIETDGLDGALFSIALVAGDTERVFMRGAGPATEGVVYCVDERALLRVFFQFFRALDPDAIIGWNVVDFDLCYLQKRCESLGMCFALGRAPERARILLPQRANQLPLARLPGRVALDGIGLLKSATYSFERFSLEHVAQKLLGRGKHIDKPSDRMGEIRRLFHEDKPALARYNLEDCRLVRDIFEHTNLLSFAIERQRMTGLPLDRVGGSVAAFDNLYLPRLHRAGYVAGDTGAAAGGGSSPGGYVLPSSPGLYDNVLVLDFKSLYPSIVRTFLVDPLGMAQPGQTPVEGFGGAQFAREGHILPGLIEGLWNHREDAKRCADKPLSRAIKIIMNSFYGVLGTPACRFYSPLLASSITRRGHEIMTHSRDWIHEQGWRVIYGDTDSLFVLLGGEHDAAACHRIGERLARGMNAWWQQRVADEHGVDCHLEMEFETHYVKFFMPTLRGSEVGSAKRYAGLVRDPEPRVVVKGLEAVRTDWTPLARVFQRELLRRAFAGEPVDDYIRGVRTRLLAGQLDDKLVYRKRLRRAIKDYTRNVPPHVRAARMLGVPVREVSYVWTARGPQPISKRSAPLDYHHYLDKQLAPAADSLLYCLGTSFERVAGNQTSLF